MSPPERQRECSPHGILDANRPKRQNLAKMAWREHSRAAVRSIGW